jgi:hypothetical protein
MKLGAALLALSLALALLGVVWARRRLLPRDTPAARRRIEAAFKGAEKTRPLDSGHYYKRYWP